MSYVDTSIIMAALDHLDSMQKLAQKDHRKYENKENTFGYLLQVVYANCIFV